MGETIIKVKEYNCERCYHKWQPRKEEHPIICPKCKSPYWNKERKNETRNGEN
ncbi:MAG: hypothetical protein ACTSQA_01505 [Candidatus Heimdallarchaeaceae archaeon]